MRLAIVGAGAIGSVIGGHLARKGHEITLICRGAHLDAVRELGLTVKTPEAIFSASRKPPTGPKMSARKTASSSLPKPIRWLNSRRA